MKFARIASIVQIVTNLGIIIAYGLSRKKVKESPICGVFGALPFQILVVLMAIVASVGSILPVA
ncbi:MAG: hypothetical protein K6G38_05970 [Gammaproteobacteria bacterium]|nr:hypothetical protein [Gammaproteobacteria bacterium]